MIRSGGCETTIVRSNPVPPTQILSDPMKVVHITAFAARWHGSQTRKDAAKTAYITHPLMVASMLQSVGCSQKTVIGGILHDVLEDTNCDENEMMLAIGAEVTALVLEVTHNKYLSREQKHEKLCEQLPYMSKEACMIKVADRTHNLRDLKDLERLPDGFTKEKVYDYARKSRQIYNIITRLGFGDQSLTTLSKFLDRAIRYIEELDDSAQS